MFMFFSIGAVVIFILMLLVAAIHPDHSKLTMYELERRSKLGDRQAKREISREKKLSNVTSIQRILVGLLQIAAFTFAELSFGLWFGIFAAAFMAFGTESMSHVKFVRKISNKIYNFIESPLLKFIGKHPLLFKVISGNNNSDYYDLRIESREELQYLVANSDSVLTADERKMIVHSLSFGDRLVRTIMTPRDKVVSISKSEFLGPLMLNDLHKIGHSWLPVKDGDLDHIVGILNLKSVLKLDAKKSKTVEKAMDSRVYYIRDDQTLHHALVALLHTHHHLLIVINEAKETVGILALEDIIEALLGREVTDEFDDYDDLRVVASRKIN